jgi:hypothetical protein
MLFLPFYLFTFLLFKDETMIDITIDFETCALPATAAIMSVGAVAWKRYDTENPFFEKSDGLLRYPTFSANVDLRSCFVKGFTFDQKTAEWWSQQSEEAKQALLDDDDGDNPCLPIDVVITDLLGWIKDEVLATLGDTDLCLWAQGTDFDVAILRYAGYKLGIEFNVKHTQFRDHRTYYLDGARLLWEANNMFDHNSVPFSVDWAYGQTQDYQDIADDGAAHDPIFDCKRSIYSTWQMMKRMRVFPIRLSELEKQNVCGS